MIKHDFAISTWITHREFAILNSALMAPDEIERRFIKNRRRNEE
jgi:hypothetical protein